MLRARRPVAAFFAVLCLLFVAACGGSDEKKPSGAAGVLAEAFGPDKPVRSGDVDAAITFDQTGLTGVGPQVKVDLEGPFQSQGGGKLPFFDLDFGLLAGGTQLKAGAVSTADKGFLKFDGADYALPAAVFTQFQKAYKDSLQAASDGDKKASGTSLQSLGVDPLRWLSAPKTVGTEQVGGVATDHVSASVDVPKLLEDVDKLLRKAGSVSGAAGQAAGVPNGLTTPQRTVLAGAVTGTTFDVWAGKDDGTLRKLDVTVAFELPEIAQAAAGGLKKGRLRLALTVADLNEKQTITAPTTTRPFAELQTQLAQLITGVFGGGAAVPGAGGTGSGSGAGTGSGSGSGTTGGSAGTAPPQNDYDACMAAAGADIAKVNECAPLLNP
ncbi:hypothetical protein DSM112329_01539 [Paraconexibacter sp. AEG42_29]|uniref:LppX_LprAFG lipoprotein n=1 Tax=Paraconexibacter sp. AEG42_29 TaxID=2997339 RepID=A0AAU7ASR4_9ACTN